MAIPYASFCCENLVWDAFACVDATMDDIDPLAVQYFLKCAVTAGRMPNEALTDNVQSTLSNLDLLTHEGKLKNAAILLFGKRPQHFFISSRFRIGRFMADDTDLIHHDDIEGNIIQMADKVMWKLRQDYLIAPIHYEGMHRVEQLEIPEAALRELVYNAIVHRDYLGADTQMKVYNDRIWLWNEGELPEGFSAEKASKEHLSKPRNRLIANVFYKSIKQDSLSRGDVVWVWSAKPSPMQNCLFRRLKTIGTARLLSFLVPNRTKQ